MSYTLRIQKFVLPLLIHVRERLKMVLAAATKTGLLVAAVTAISLRVGQELLA
jgi:hypothetical protein